MNRTDPWCVYLTSQLHEKFGFSQGEAHHMVFKWLRSIKSLPTIQSHEAKNQKVSARGRVQRKTASARV